MQIQSLDIKTDYKKEDIVNVLMANQTAHIEHYVEAEKVYLSRILEETEKFVIKMAEWKYGDPLPVSQHNFGLTQPVNQNETYDDLIKVFSSMVASCVTLNMSDAHAIFNDSWGWASSATAVNSLYASNRKYL